MNRNKYLTERPITVVEAEKSAAEELRKKREAERDSKKQSEAAKNMAKIVKQKIRLTQSDTPPNGGYGGCGGRGGCGM